MNIDELKQLLKQYTVRKDLYEFEKEFPNESYCLRFNGENWEAYYSERGSKSGLKFFESESEACEYFFEVVFRDKRA